MNTRRIQHTTIVLAALLMGLFLAGCGRFDLDMKDGGMTIKAKFDEKAINRFLRDENTHSSDKILDEISRVDFQDGFVRVFGQVHTKEDGWKDGSYDLALSALEGQLVSEIVAVDVPGVELDDPRIQKINTHLAKEFAKIAAIDHGQVKFKDVSVTDKTAQFVVRLLLDQEK